MNYYAQGNGHVDLANKLGMTNAKSLAANGSCNRRIIRTTLRDCFANTEPTLYILGMTFLTRYEFPAAQNRQNNDGKWISFTRSSTSMNKEFDPYFTQQNLLKFWELYDKFTLLGLPDLAEDLMYSILSLISTLHYRGHKVVIFNTAEHTVEYFLKDSAFDLFRQQKEVVGGFEWRSIPWQFKQGADYSPEDEQYPADSRHVAPGQHHWLNEFLTNYLREHNIL